MSPLSYLNNLDLLLSFCGTALVVHYAFLRSKKLPLPPGPEPLPFIGNLLDMPKSEELEAFHWAKHKALYGTISRCNSHY